MDLDADACYRAICTRDARFDGRLFIGVKTTGIYCRPVCPARTPKRENVLFYPSAAAAQSAGFRPCLRCRPETAPDLGVWRGTSNTVSRALSLIDKGGLDGADVETLADRLGVGDRQLRRLFHRHLGASPIAVAQTRRVLLAKQLIHESRLSMAEIALAAGFGSIRRFNETFQHLFGRPPKSLRRDGLPEGSTGHKGEVAILLRYRPPYDWPGVIEFLRARAIPGLETVSRDGYARAIEIAGVHGTVSVRAAEGNALRATIHFPQLSALPTIVARLRRVFDLAADPEVIGAHLAEDPVLAPLVAARPGLRVPGRVGRLRARGAGRARPADHGQRGSDVGGQARGDLRRTLGQWSPERRRAHARLPLSGAPDRGESGRARHARGARRGACLPGPRGGVRSSDLRAETEPRRSDRPASSAARRRRVDRPVHRHARAPRAGRVPRG